jgi:hypothetical protein
MSSLEKLNWVKQQYDISEQFIEPLTKLIGFEIVLLCDDSGSMIQTGSYDKFQHRYLSRWEELQQRVQIMVDLVTCIDPDGIDIYWLNNRAPQLNVRDSKSIGGLFAFIPYGGTPINSALARIIRDKQHVIKERKLLIIIATDGEFNGIDGKEEFINTIRNRKPIESIYISIMACTDNKHTLKYLNHIEKNIPNTNIVDDYQTEKTKILKYKQIKTFSIGDYMAFALLGSVTPFFNNPNNKNHCVII